MSQPIPASPQKPRIRWRWAILIAVCCTPLVMVAVLSGLYIVVRQEQIRTLEQQQASRRALFDARHLEDLKRVAAESSPVRPPAASQGARKQAQVVRIQVDFEGFDSQTADAITMESSNGEYSGSRLMVPSEVTAPITAKINGRMVTRKVSHIRVVDVEHSPIGGMGVAGMAMPPSSASGPGVSSMGITILRDHLSIGLTELWWQNAFLTPVRVFGDFPKATVGEKLHVITSSANALTSMLTVLGTDETVDLANGGHFEHLLKLTECPSSPGSMVCNQAGDPIGQIVFTVPGKLTQSYAVPMDRIFATIHESRLKAIESLSQSIPRLEEAISRDLPPFDTPSDLLPGTTIGAEGQALAPSLPAGDFPKPTGASVPDLSITQDERLIYRVQGSAQDAAKTVRSLYGEVKVAVDEGRQAVIVSASPNLQDKIAATIEVLNTRARELRAEQTRQAEIEENHKRTNSRKVEPDELDEVYEIVSGMFHWVDITIDERAGTFLMSKLDPRTPQEVVEWLSHFFGKKADFAIDESAGTVLITVKEPITRAEVNSKMAEPIATTAPPAVSEQSPPVMSKPGGTGMQSQDPLNVDQDREVKNLALQFRSVAPSEQVAVRAKLEQQVERQFRQRQLQRKQEIDDLSYRIEKLRTSQLWREEHRTDIIRRRVGELLDPNNDLDWDEPQGVPVTMEQPADEAPPRLPIAKTTPTTTLERTFDGIVYSQWRRILETERKPAKLIAAMDACSRLGMAEDARQVTKALIQSAAFETSDLEERREIWSAAVRSLQRMPADVVIDEIVASINPIDSASHDRSFQGLFLTERHPAALRDALKARDLEVVAAFIKAIRPNNEDRHWLLAAACGIWENSDHQLKDFEGLESLVMKRIETPPPVIRNVFFDKHWWIVANALTRKNPETPGLAVKLMTYAERDDASFNDMLPLVKQLGLHGEPAVSMIVEQFLARWKKIEDVAAADAKSGRRRDEAANPVPAMRAAHLIHVLGGIRTGTQAATLVKELTLMGTLTHNVDQSLRTVFTAAQEEINNFADVPTDDSPPILPDESLIRGVWQVHSLNSVPVEKYEAWMTRNYVDWVDNRNGQVFSNSLAEQYIGYRMELDSTKTPKEIAFRAPAGSDPKLFRLGIYELTETKLKIYLSPLGKSRPSEMTIDAAAIPEGYSLIELRRSLPTKEGR